jgi:hypothetical protein
VSYGDISDIFREFEIALVGPDNFANLRMLAIQSSADQFKIGYIRARQEKLLD